jgi:hypothetical protein
MISHYRPRLDLLVGLGLPPTSARAFGGNPVCCVNTFPSPRGVTRPFGFGSSSDRRSPPRLLDAPHPLLSCRRLRLIHQLFLTRLVMRESTGCRHRRSVPRRPTLRHSLCRSSGQFLGSVPRAKRLCAACAVPVISSVATFSSFVRSLGAAGFFVCSTWWWRMPSVRGKTACTWSARKPFFFQPQREVEHVFVGRAGVARR